MKTFDPETPISQSDINGGKLVLRKRSEHGAVLPSKLRVNIFLDAAIVEHFKHLAGGRGYQTLINETLKHAMQADDLQQVVRQTIREEMQKQAGR